MEDLSWSQGHNKDRLVTTIKSADSTDSDRRMTVDDFEILALIGRGTFGDVHLVRRKDRSVRELYGVYSMHSTEILYVIAFVNLLSAKNDGKGQHD
jgi:serine/threonine protein kinase